MAAGCSCHKVVFRLQLKMRTGLSDGCSSGMEQLGREVRACTSSISKLPGMRSPSDNNTYSLFFAGLVCAPGWKDDVWMDGLEAAKIVCVDFGTRSTRSCLPAQLIELLLHLHDLELEACYFRPLLFYLQLQVVDPMQQGRDCV